MEVSFLSCLGSLLQGAMSKQMEVVEGDIKFLIALLKLFGLP